MQLFCAFLRFIRNGLTRRIAKFQSLSSAILNYARSIWPPDLWMRIKKRMV